MGSPSYMAPEQAEGRSRQVGPAADIYALGAILYELLTGRPPFKAATALETLQQVKAIEPVPPGRLQPGLPRDLETICLKCLEKEPARRYATAGALAEELNRFLRHEPILARPIGRLERVARWCRHNPALAGCLGLVALLDAGADRRLDLGRGGSPEGSLAAAPNAMSPKATRPAPSAAENDATEKLWGADLARAQAGRWSGRVGRRFEGLEALKQAAALDVFPGRRGELRDEAIACMSLLDLSASRAMGRGPIARTRRERWRSTPSTSDSCVSTRMGGSGCDARPTGPSSCSSRSPRPTSTGPASAPTADTSSWNTTYYEAKPANCQVWDLDRGKLINALTSYLTAYSFSPDGRQMAIALMGGSVCFYDLPAATLAGRWEAGSTVRPIAFHPSGAQLGRRRSPRLGDPHLRPEDRAGAEDPVESPLR